MATVTNRNRNNPRVTTISTVYYQPVTGEPSSVNVRWAMELENDEQIYARTMSLGEEWVSIDTGWVKDPGMLILKNDAVDKTIMQVGLAFGDVVKPAHDLPKGASVSMIPTDFSSLRIRYAKGTHKVTINALPK